MGTDTAKAATDEEQKQAVQEQEKNDEEQKEKEEEQKEELEKEEEEHKEKIEKEETEKAEEEDNEEKEEKENNDKEKPCDEEGQNESPDVVPTAASPCQPQQQAMTDALVKQEKKQAALKTNIARKLAKTKQNLA